MNTTAISKISAAWNDSTKRFNAFKACVQRMKWIDTYSADDELYFEGQGFTLIVKSLDPFEQCEAPRFMCEDGSFFDINFKSLFA